MTEIGSVEIVSLDLVQFLLRGPPQISYDAVELGIIEENSVDLVSFVDVNVVYGLIV